MKQWDWEKAKECNRPEKLEYLKANHNKPITLDEYMAEMKRQKPTKNQPSHIEKEYKRLKNSFGFFAG